MGDHGRRLFSISSSAAKKKGHFWFLIHEGIHMKIHIQIIHIPLTSPSFLISRCFWRYRHTQKQTLKRRYWMKFRPSDYSDNNAKGDVLLAKFYWAAKLPCSQHAEDFFCFIVILFICKLFLKCFQMWDIRCLIHKWLEAKAIPNNNSVPIVCILLIAGSTLC